MITLRAVQASIAALLAVAGSLAFQPPADAATKVLTTDHGSQAWYWNEARDFRACSPVAPPQPLPNPCSPYTGTVPPDSPITPGHLPVSVRAGNSDMRSYIKFLFPYDLRGAQAQSFVLSLSVSRSSDTSTTHTGEHANAKPPATANEDMARIQACLMVSDFGPIESGPPDTIKDSHDPTTTEPAEPIKTNGVDTSSCIEGKRGDRWAFDLTPFARLWLAGQKDNDGVALLPIITAPTDDWTVEFHGAAYSVENDTAAGSSRIVYVSPPEEATATLKYEPAPVEKVQESPPPVVTPPVVETGGGSTTPSVPVDTPSATPVPSATPTQLPQTAPIASHPRTPWYAWLMLPLGLLGIIVAQRTLGTESAPGNDNRVATTLRDRKRRAGE